MQDFHKDYNTQKESLILKEYGRNVQKLVKYITTLKDREERTRAAYVLINLMKQLNPSVREHNDNAQRIWDHLYHMSDFRLDIESPYPTPAPGELYQKPQRLGYNNHQIKFKHYGRNVELLIEKVLQIEDKTEQMNTVQYIVRLMKTFYSAWNKENVEDEVILEHIRQLSDGRIDLTSSELRRGETDGGINRNRTYQQQPLNKPPYPNNYYSQQGNGGDKRRPSNNTNGNNDKRKK